MATRVRLTRLRCNNANEGGPFSSDEPYVITATIAPGGLLGRRLLFDSTRTFGEVDAGENRHPNLDLINEDIQGSVAVVAQVLEHDDSEKELIILAATGAAQVAFANAMANGGTTLRELRTTVANAIHDGVVAARLPFVDDDDDIGHPAVFSVSATRFRDMNVGDAFNMVREVEGSDARYTLTFEVRRLP